jgi:Holliday junction resolvase RusA-like endonuclease
MLIPELPFPPSLNHYYRRLGHVTLISRRGRAYRDAVVALLASQRQLTGKTNGHNYCSVSAVNK